MCWVSWARATTYHISPQGADTNSGTAARPWKTISKANAQLQPGDTVLLRTGTYAEVVKPARPGLPGSPITYKNGPGQTPVISDVPIAIRLQDLSHIVVDGLTVDGDHVGHYTEPDPATVLGWVFMQGGDHHVIQNCLFQYASSYGISVGGGGHHHRFLNNTMRYVGSPAAGGNNTVSLGEDTHHILFEGNDLSYAGHYLFMLGTRSKHHVVRNNHFHSHWHGNADTWRSSHSLFELNRNSHVIKTTTNDAEPSGLRMQGVHNIIRRNVCYNNEFWASNTNVRPDRDPPLFTTNTKIYHNVFYGSGDGGAWQFVYKKNAAGLAEGMEDNAFKNNIAFRNNHPVSIIVWPMVTPPAEPMLGLQIAGNNLMGGDIEFRNVFGHQTLAWCQANHSSTFWANIRRDPLFVDPDAAVPDFSLRAGSPCVDAAVYLTRTTAAGRGTVMAVEDAAYFCDGFGIVQGDLVQLQGDTRQVRVTQVDHDRNLLHVASPLEWSAEQGVTLAYHGRGPDIGAFEYAPASHPRGAPEGPGEE